MHTIQTTPGRLFLAGAAVLLVALACGCSSDGSSDDDKDAGKTGKAKPSKTDYLGTMVHIYNKRHDVACKTNLHGLSSAIMMYRTQNRNVYPTNFEQLIEAGILDGGPPTCPAKGAKPYVLIPPAGSNTPWSAVIVRDATAVHGDHVNVLRADGSVGQMSLEEADRVAPLPPAK